MRVAWAFLRVGILEGLQYRVEALIWFLFDLLPPVVMLFLWLAVYAGRAEVAGYSLDQMLGYYIGILILGTLVTAHVEWSLSHDIRQGLLSAYLLRPVSPWLYWFMGSLAWKVLRGLFLLPSTALVVVALGGTLHLPALSPLQLGVLLLSIAAAYVLCYLFKAMIGLLAVWLTDISGLSGLWEVSMYVLGGAMLPLSLLPAPVQALATVLPFKYIYAYSLTLALGRQSEAEMWNGLAIQFAWLLLAAGLARLLWQRALRRYEAVGS